MISEIFDSGISSDGVQISPTKKRITTAETHDFLGSSTRERKAGHTKTAAIKKRIPGKKR